MQNESRACSSCIWKTSYYTSIMLQSIQLREQRETDIFAFKPAEHALYSPNLVPLDFAYFPDLKAYMRGQKYEDRYIIWNALLLKHSEEWYHNVFSQMFDQHRECIQHNGEYFKKQ